MQACPTLPFDQLRYLSFESADAFTAAYRVSRLETAVASVSDEKDYAKIYGSITSERSGIEEDKDDARVWFIVNNQIQQVRKQQE